MEEARYSTGRSRLSGAYLSFYSNFYRVIQYDEMDMKYKKNHKPSPPTKLIPWRNECSINKSFFNQC